jgi:hypothetical protein
MGGNVDNIQITHSEMTSVSNILYVNISSNANFNQSAIPIFKNITFFDITATNANVAGVFDCHLSPCKHFTLNNIQISGGSNTGVNPKFYCKNITGTVFDVQPTPCFNKNSVFHLL